MQERVYSIPTPPAVDHRTGSKNRVATGPWKSLKKCSFFQGLESPWKWNRSLKVLEFYVKGPWKSLNLSTVIIDT